MADIEIWRTPIYDGETYEDYKVSNWGRILSLNYLNTGKSELLKPENVKGYLRVVLYKNGETKKCLVHRLVAFTFLENPEGKPQVNHKIEGKKGKSMNFVFFNEDGTIDEKRTTIEWVTAKENSNHGTRNERMAKTKTNGKKSKKVLQLSLDGDLIREWPSTHECGRNGFCQVAVSDCCRGKLKTYKGFRWEYE